MNEATVATSLSILPVTLVNFSIIVEHGTYTLE